MSDDVVNPKPEIEEACKPKCIKAWLEYEVRAFQVDRSPFDVHKCTCLMVKWNAERLKRVIAGHTLTLRCSVHLLAQTVPCPYLVPDTVSDVPLDSLTSKVCECSVGLPKESSRRYHRRGSLHRTGMTSRDSGCMI